MSRPLRIEYPDAWHHVMNRARQGQTLYGNTADYRRFLDLLEDTADMFNIRVSSYCFMPTHYHLLVQTPDANLARCMRHINGVYTQWYNRRYGYEGTLFRGRYKSILIDADSYLLQLVRYIHRNPITAGLVEKLSQYPWSSHKGYISKAMKWDWLNKDFILSMLSSKSHQRIRRYNQFVNESDSEEINRFFNQKNVPPILGSEKFIDWIKGKFLEEKSHMEVPASKMLSPNIAMIEELVCRFYQITPDRLLVVKRGTKNEPRDISIYLMRRLCGTPLLKIGAEFQLKKHSSVSSVLERTEKRLDTDRRFRNRFEKLKDMLTRSQTET